MALLLLPGLLKEEPDILRGGVWVGDQSRSACCARTSNVELHCFPGIRTVDTKYTLV